MGASKTGSGKTLSYLVPIIERLYMQKWSEWDGLGALIILPTRELALQVFEVLNSISDYHELSIGLVIGGKDVQYEKDNIANMNILVATPGRLLQHMDETVGFNCQNLQVLAIDEADMLFELGFAETLNCILENIPKGRQTLLFSATLSKKVHQLGKLSLKEPEYIFLHERTVGQKKEKENGDNEAELEEEDETGKQKTKLQDMYETPFKLMQYYMVVNIEEKLNSLFSFLKAHQKQKVLVFLSTCKQVRFVYETFKKLKLGLPIMELHGRQKTTKRMAIFYAFTEKKHAVMITTNLAARGLDFPAVNWVVQVDCPDNTETYIHRIGRTARYKQDGKSLLLLTPQEEKFAQKLKDKNVQLHKLLQNPQKALSVTSTLQAFCSEDMDIKYLAQRAFVSYMRSVYLNGDSEIFDVHKINVKEFAESIGLVQTPVIKFKKQIQDEEEENEDDDEDDDSEAENKKEGIEEEDDDDEDEEDDEKKTRGNKKLSKIEKLKQKRLLERQERKNKKLAKIDIINMKDEEQELEVAVHNQIKKESSMNIKHKKLKNRTTNIFDDNNKNIENEDNDEEDDFLVKKKKTSVDLFDLEKEVQEEQGKQLPKLSKNQMKKIKMDGHYGGMNVMKITQDGKYITKEDMTKQEMAENLKRIEEQEKTMDYSQKYALKKYQNAEQDELLNKQRIKDKQIKKKQQKYQKEMEKKGGAAILGGEEVD
uniref:ATP-dependent RNA helicase n=1 Tax=Philasterides dicentrarchi TaxID=282688 RepID=A0A481XS27_9CILI|nr:DExD/H box RNA helicase 41 [Philasterides dicentrarchi]